MRYRDLSSKEIVNLEDGSRLGVLGQTDLELDPKTGQIHAFLVPSYRMFGIKRDQTETTIRWAQIKKIGKDTIIVQRTN
ncbi:sporulation protein, YlmC/YmxH family [Amphibacillus marinus]|uniref:Sporulation protein, YlmC/YmxH family n=1 Tax=Amphibacillus marinus TaxID=872970 RepID=A0A1H8NQT9_9BACI|nr:YlmC/YmxH family sporulation protein [Amphibacillus marinus]SEO31909.1 sporulation protein, YlmC/YmxH family [Amphibacillus marinus]